ncbi:MAG: hypothetical protein ABIH86_05275 [Planctomycetota bacterium]
MRHTVKGLIGSTAYRRPFRLNNTGGCPMSLVKYGLLLVAVAAAFSADAARLKKLNTEQLEFLSGPLERAKRKKVCLLVYIWDVNVAHSQKYLSDRKYDETVNKMDSVFEVESLNMANSKMENVARDLAQVSTREDLPVFIVLGPDGTLLFWSAKYTKYKPDDGVRIILSSLLKTSVKMLARKEEDRRELGAMILDNVCEIAENVAIDERTLGAVLMLTRIGRVKQSDFGRFARKRLTDLSAKLEAEQSERVLVWFEKANNAASTRDKETEVKMLTMIIAYAPLHPIADKARKRLNTLGEKFTDPLEQQKSQVEEENKKELLGFGDDSSDLEEPAGVSNPGVDSTSPDGGISTTTTGGLTAAEAGPEPDPETFIVITENGDLVRLRRERKAQAALKSTRELKALFPDLAKRRFELLLDEFADTDAALDIVKEIGQ